MYARFKYKPQQVPLNIYPATVPFQDRPALGLNTKGASFTMTDAWRAFIWSINSERAAEKYFQPRIFATNDPEGRKFELITTGGNVVRYNEVINNHLWVSSWRFDEDPHSTLGIDGMSYITSPWLIHKATAVHFNSDGSYNVYKIAGGLDIYYPILNNGRVWTDRDGHTYPAGLYVDMSEVELFPSLPREVRVTAPLGVIIRSTPAGARVAPWPGGVLGRGSKVTIFEYRPRGSDVWGKFDKGWICLAQNQSFYTTWAMATTPPIPA